MLGTWLAWRCDVSGTRSHLPLGVVLLLEQRRFTSQRFCGNAADEGHEQGCSDKRAQVHTQPGACWWQVPFNYGAPPGLIQVIQYDCHGMAPGSTHMTRQLLFAGHKRGWSRVHYAEHGTWHHTGLYGIKRLKGDHD